MTRHGNCEADEPQKWWEAKDSVKINIEGKARGEALCAR